MLGCHSITIIVNHHYDLSLANSDYIQYDDKTLEVVSDKKGQAHKGNFQLSVFSYKALKLLGQIVSL